MTIQSYSPDVEALLKLNVEDFEATDAKVLLEISNFNWLWPLFEAKYFETDARFIKIIALQKCRFKNIDPQSANLQAAHHHFRNRYVDEYGCAKAELLSLVSSDETLAAANHDHVAHYTEGLTSSPDTKEWFIALILIVFRLRNRLFHGVKGDVGFEDQLDNFSHANSILMALIKGM